MYGSGERKSIKMQKWGVAFGLGWMLVKTDKKRPSRKTNENGRK
jgi:hypothetical protein